MQKTSPIILYHTKTLKKTYHTIFSITPPLRPPLYVNKYIIFIISLLLLRKHKSKSVSDLIPISDEKFNDLQDLKHFCSKETRDYYDNLPHALKENKGEIKKDKNKTATEV